MGGDAMRYDTAVYFQTLSQGTYDEETGELILKDARMGNLKVKKYVFPHTSSTIRNKIDNSNPFLSAK